MTRRLLALACVLGGIWLLSCSASSSSPFGGTAGSGNAGNGNGGNGAGASGGAGGTVIVPGGGSGGEQGGSGAAGPGDDCAESAKVLYLVTEENLLYSFNPTISGMAAYDKIGTLTCESASTPQSMSVDRSGKAYVFYSAGHLYNVSTTDAHCTPTSYHHPTDNPQHFNQLGMGFTADAPDSQGQILYIHSPDFGLATVDLQSFVVNQLNVLKTDAAELTGGPDAKLFLFAADSAELSEIDRTNFQKTLLHTFNMSGVMAWAFARYAGTFYMFTASGNPTWGTVNTTVTTAYDPVNDTDSVRDPDIGVTVVGAGQSTCVPPPPPIK